MHKIGRGKQTGARPFKSQHYKQLLAQLKSSSQAFSLARQLVHNKWNVNA